MNNSFLNHQLPPFVSHFLDGSATLQITNNIYLTDLLDILIISLFIYTIFILFKRTRSFLILLGLGIILLLYIIAQLFNLYLTSIALRYFFGVFVVFFVVIFQPELRRFFELIGLTGQQRIKFKHQPGKSISSLEIIHACAVMARQKIGALIIIQGRDQLLPFLEGGVVLDGLVSEELILSLFDPHSAGHDGAMIVTDNHVSRFGTHLPLSNNFKEIGKHGTRHSAALGLAENTDALAIVVSEEKGTISIARENHLKVLDGPQDLEKEVSRYLSATFSEKPRKIWQQIFQKEFGLKLSSLGIALVLWFFVAYQADIVKKTYTIPITFANLPSDTVMENVSPKEISFTALGRGQIPFTNIDANSFSISLDAGRLSDGVNTMSVSASDIKHPITLSVSNLDSSSILLSVKKYVRSTVPIKVQTAGQLTRGYSISSIVSTPNEISIWTPQNLPPPLELTTEPVDITAKVDPFVTAAQIILPKDVRLLKPNDSQISVAVTLTQK